MEVIDIGLSDLEPISIQIDDKPTTSTIGSGIELLMNDKRRNTGQTNVSMEDLDKLESDLNDLSSRSSMPYGSASAGAGGGSGSGGNGFGLFESTSKTLSGLGNMFGLGGSSKEAPKNDDGYEQTSSRLGSATAESVGNNRTWDGFTKLQDIPENKYEDAPSVAKLSEREKRRKKRLMLKKLEEWREKGLISGSSHFNMDSNYEEIEDEYETALDDKRKKDSIKLQGWWFMTAINSVEYMNAAFNPFDLNLDGWGEQVSEDIESYEEIFAELHEKYKGGKLSPELSLLLRIGFSAAVVNFSNKALSSAAPGFNDVIKQSPELMKMFTDATVKSMNNNNPGFAFASNLMNKPDQVNTSFGPPPKPVETKNMAPPLRQMQYTEPSNANSNRPDIAMGRGAMFREKGMEVGGGYADANAAPERSYRPTPPPMNVSTPASAPTPVQLRPEMRGPQTDIDSILSGLKTKTVNIHEQRANTPVESVLVEDVNDSLISISSLKDMQNNNMPKRTSGRRRNTSNKNTISLDI
jgi:hypothetical protein